MQQIRLTNGTTYHIHDYATPSSFVIILDSVTADEALETLTEENLSKIQFMTDSRAVTGMYRNQLLSGYVDHGDSLEIHINDADLVRHGMILDENNRILSAMAKRYAPEDAIIVDNLPDGNLHDYLFIDGEYVYDPLPAPEPSDPKPTQEERIQHIEEQNAMLTECILEMSGLLYA